MAEGLFVALFLLLWVAMLVAVVGGLVLWIMALVEVVKYPDPVFRAAGTEKTTWVLIIVLAGSIGALIYWFGPRKKLKAAEPYAYAWGYGAPGNSPQYPQYPPQYPGQYPQATHPGQYYPPPGPGAAPPPPGQRPPPPPAG